MIVGSTVLFHVEYECCSAGFLHVLLSNIEA